MDQRTQIIVAPRSPSYLEKPDRQHCFGRDSRCPVFGKLGLVLEHAKTPNSLIFGTEHLPATVRPVGGARFDPVFMPARDDPVFRLHGELMAWQSTVSKGRGELLIKPSL
jgi:hypothetical protein